MPPRLRSLHCYVPGLAAVLVLTAACGGSQPSPTVTATTTATATVTATATITVTTKPATAPAYVVSPESCGALSYGADGNAGPATCPDGRPNLAADRYLRPMHLRVLALGANADPGQVLAAMCKDMATNSTIPIETTAYEVAMAEQGWHFGVDPSQELLNGC